jgi:hypothetical protein
MQNLPAWFAQYYGRQTIEAGIKEGKQVFYLYKIKIRSESAIYLQKCFMLFAANFIRFAAHWLVEQAQPVKNALEVGKLGIKCQEQVAAQALVQVTRNSEGRLLKFSKQIVFAGKMLRLHGSSLTVERTRILQFWPTFHRFVSDCTTVTLGRLGGYVRHAGILHSTY